MFSMPFFDFSSTGGNNAVSPQFWIYWVVSIPLTIIVILSWTIWYRWSIHQHRLEDEQQTVDDAIFGALDGTSDRMEMDFEFVRRHQRHHHRKTKPSPLMNFLTGRQNHLHL
jgi:hypothetical protein